MIFRMLNSTKADGNISIKYGDEECAINNRKKFFSKNNIPIKNTLIIQVNYSDDIFHLDGEFIRNNSDLSQLVINADCVITRLPNVFIYLPFADCIPLGIYDKKNNILAFAHMGWQSIELNLHKKLIDALVNDYHTKIEDLEVILGPSIKGDSYILKNPSQLKHEDWKPFLKNIGDEYYQIDLNGYICRGLNEIGIKNILNSNIDTSKDNNYFSHYRCIHINKTEQEGRFICGVIMEE
jgi:polyphenol oxidase